MNTIEQDYQTRYLNTVSKMGCIGYESSAALDDIRFLKEWVGNGYSRKTTSMKSLCESLERRLARIIADSK